MQGTTKGKDLYSAVMESLNIVDIQKLSGLCSDGAPSVVGKNGGMVGQLKQNGFDVFCFHCIIHQEALCAKTLGLKDVMNSATKVVNKIVTMVVTMH